MKVEHIALYVRDLEGAREFFTRFFGAEAGEAYHNPRTGLKTYFLSFGDGARVEIMSRPEMEDREKGLYPPGLQRREQGGGGSSDRRAGRGRL